MQTEPKGHPSPLAVARQGPIEPNRRVGGLDYFRVIAVVLVACQHAMTVAGYEESTTYGRINIGQLGVAIFLGVSAWLAGQDRGAPLRWLGRRLLRVFPCFWLVMAASFLLVWLTKFKTFDAYQVLCQLFGLGLWTHAGRMINTPTWFISLLLTCYAWVVAVRFLGFPTVLGWASTFCAGIVAYRDDETWVIMHLFTFFMVFSMAAFRIGDHGRRTMSSLMGILLLGLASLRGVFAYPLAALLALELSRFLSEPPRPVREIAAISYQFYLVHGIFLTGLVYFFPNQLLLAIAAAIALSLVCAKVLQVVLEFVLESRPNRSKSPHNSVPA